MATEQEINADCTKLVILRPEQMAWEKTGQPCVERTVLERVNHVNLGRETSLLRMAPNTRLPLGTPATRTEIFVVEGSFSDGHGEYDARTFVMSPPGAELSVTSSEGCVLYIKRLNGFVGANGRIVVDTQHADWIPFGERVAEIVVFYRDDVRAVTGRVGRVFPKAQIPEHDHPGGEEVLILEGVFGDQFGDAIPGTWMRYPIGLAHAPFSGEDGALIYIRDGDVRW